MQPILIIDNYDSFTYNLVHYLEALDCKVTVIRNNKIEEEIIDKFSKIIISPGSGLPNEAGLLQKFLIQNHQNKSILGICLGQQAIAELFGSKLEKLDKVYHGVSCSIKHLNNDYIYDNIPSNFSVGLYFSWKITNLPKELIVTAISKNGIPMSIKHESLDIRALQYHPESILTDNGKLILKNWLEK